MNYRSLDFFTKQLFSFLNQLIAYSTTVKWFSSLNDDYLDQFLFSNQLSCQHFQNYLSHTNFWNKISWKQRSGLFLCPKSSHIWFQKYFCIFFRLINRWWRTQIVFRFWTPQQKEKTPYQKRVNQRIWLDLQKIISHRRK